VITRRHSRARKVVEAEYGQRQAERDHQQNLAVIGAQTAIGVATIRGEAKVQAARETAFGLIRSSDARVEAAQWRVQQMEDAWAHRRSLDELPQPVRSLEAVPQPAPAAVPEPAAPRALEPAAPQPAADFFDLADHLGFQVRR
jgi:hypothetical protein